MDDEEEVHGHDEPMETETVPSTDGVTTNGSTPSNTAADILDLQLRPRDDNTDQKDQVHDGLHGDNPDEEDPDNNQQAAVPTLEQDKQSNLDTQPDNEAGNPPVNAPPTDTLHASTENNKITPDKEAINTSDREATNDTTSDSTEKDSNLQPTDSNKGAVPDVMRGTNDNVGASGDTEMASQDNKNDTLLPQDVVAQSPLSSNNDNTSDDSESEDNSGDTEPVDSDGDRTPSKDQDESLEPQLKRLGTGDTEIVDDPKKDEMPRSKSSRKKKKKKQKSAKKGEVSKPKDRSKSKDKSLTPKIGGWSDEEKGASFYLSFYSSRQAEKSWDGKIELPTLSRYSSFDAETYRKGYPGKPDNPRITSNYMFYMNEIKCYPDGDFIDVIHEKWWGNYSLLEYSHSYIQWLFPIREKGMNYYAQELQLHEAEKIRADPVALNRVIKSYEMMLDFYGLKLKSRETGEVERSQNYQDRFRNLNMSSHNYLRITRILKCLGEFEFGHYQAPLVRHFLKEAIVERTLVRTLNSCVNYWIQVVLDDEEREELLRYAKELVDEENSKLHVQV